ncbi:MAG TPA: ABC transporter permease [Gemmatimonadaceae bacterium]|nr:ABC transporter permease [Gemmatimonadaceae bacterium]
MPHPDSEHHRRFQLPWRSARRIQADLEEELAFELDMRTAELVQQGIPEAEARRRAMTEFGDLDETRRVCVDLDRGGERAAQRAEWFAELRQDARLAWRGMRRTPGFAAVVLATLALGIGANTAVFSVVRKALLDQLPYREPDRLVRIYGGQPGVPDARGMLTLTEIATMQQSRAFADAAVFGMYGGATYVGDQRAEMWQGVQVGPQFFHVLGVRALLGRTIDARDTAGDAMPVVVLSYALWQRTFAGDSSIVGRDVQLDGHMSTVVGVMPATFVSPDRQVEMWAPLNMRRYLRNPVVAWRNRMFNGIARLADGVTAAQLHSTLDVLARREHERYPELHGVAPANAVPLRDAMVGDVRPALLVVMGAAALVLLLACVNVAGLFLAHATARRRELAVRAALGAGRARLVRQLLTESAMIGLAGGALGVGLAFWGKHVLVDVARAVLPSIGDVRIDAGILVFALGLSLLSALAFGLAPALAGTRFDLHGSLAESSRGASGGRASARTGRVLVAAQVALAVMLLIGAGLLGRTLVALEQTGVGYDVGSDVLTFNVALSSPRYASTGQRTAFFTLFTRSLRALPGVRGVGRVVVAPWEGYTAFGPDSFAVEGRARAAGIADLANQVTVSAGYFAALDIPVRRGRAFTSLDRENAPLVAVISESLAREYWPGASPLGQRIRLGNQRAPWMEVVGVVGDVRERPSDDAPPTVYVPMQQHPQGWAAVVVRTTGNATALVPAIRRVLYQMDPALPVVGAQTMRDVFNGMLSAQRLPMIFTTAFAMLALILAALGTYSVLAYSVTARHREFGIRTALGARRGSVLALVVRQGMTMALIGTVVGLLLAAAGTRVLTGLLVGVTPHDPVTFVAVPLILLAVSAAACLIPARRATRVEPVEALRAE